MTSPFLYFGSFLNTNLSSVTSVGISSSFISPVSTLTFSFTIVSLSVDVGCFCLSLPVKKNIPNKATSTTTIIIRALGIHFLILFLSLSFQLLNYLPFAESETLKASQTIIKINSPQASIRLT